MADRNSYVTSGKALQAQNDASPTTILNQRRAFLDARIGLLAKWVRGGVRPEALIRFALLDMQNNPKLREADPQSIYLALLACAVTGLEPGALHGHAYLVPFFDKKKGCQVAQFMAGFKGLIKMAKRSGEVSGITANVVHARDDFSIDLGTGNTVVHRPSFGDRGDVIGAYSIARMKDNTHELEWMDIEDLQKIQKGAEARGPSPAWQSWPDEMRRKTVIRRLAKRLPLGHDYIISVAIEQSQDDTGDAKGIIDLETDGAASQSDAQLASAPQMQEPAFDPTADMDPS